MMLSAGARLGPYEIVSAVGAGGMGEVYRARDTRLNRTVAIKLLPAEFRERSERRLRFEAEARAISSLNHPHICTLFDVGEQDGVAFFVMEYLEGETLDDRLASGPLPAKEVLLYAPQIADALDHAHREQFVHRDLKPSNVMLTPSGAKLLDFGLTRGPIRETSTPASTISLPPGKLTAEGTIVGTFQYMAPEQLEGKDADARTDVFAFGTLLYEMATGRKAFEGRSQVSLIASILTEHPPPISSTHGNNGLPPALDHLVERCLAKNPDDRWQTARDVRLELDWITDGGSRAAQVATAPIRRRGREMLAWAAAAVLAVSAFAAALVGVREPSNEDIVRFVLAPPSGFTIGIGEQRHRLAISPDGRHLAFVAFTEGRQEIWLRSLSSLAPQPLAGTEGAVSPFWSPDSRYIGFIAPGAGELKKVAIAGGPSRTICAADIEGLPAWGADGTILFSKFRDGIFRVSADGGTPARVTSLDHAGGESNHYWPGFLPDGKHFTYMAIANKVDTSASGPSVYVAALDGTNRTPLDGMHSRVVYAPPGYLLFVEEGALLAQRFDLARLQVIGEATRIADGVGFVRDLGSGNFSVSSTGTVAYLGGSDAYQIVWYDRHGKATDTGWAKQNYGSLRISPNGQHVATDVIDRRSGASDIWIYDLARNVPIRFTNDPLTERHPVWAPDGRHLLFTANHGGPPSLFMKAFEASGDEKPLVSQPDPLGAEDWSPDNRLIAYNVNTRKTAYDIWMKPLIGETGDRVFLNMRFEERGARFSPDSAWVAFNSQEASDTPEVFVAPVGQPGQRKQVSIGGGTGPRWRRDGRELFYVSADNRSIVSVPIESLSPFKAGIPVHLFTIGREPAARDRQRSTVYDVMPDGQRFLISLPAGEPESSRITVVVNWPEALKQ